MNKNDRREILAKRAKQNTESPVKNQNKLNDEFLKYMNGNNNNNGAYPNTYNINFAEKYYPHLIKNNNEQNIATNVMKAIRAKRAMPVKKSAMFWLNRVRKRLARPNLTGNVVTGNTVKLSRIGMNRARKNNVNVNLESYKVNGGNLVQNNVRTGVSQVWLKRQAAYIRGLSEYDFKTLLAFTHNSSTWVGKYERTGNLPNIGNYYDTFNTSVLNNANKRKIRSKKLMILRPLVPQIRKILGDAAANTNRLKNNSLHRKALDMYRADLHRIIRNAPALPATMMVYRGLQTDPFKGSVGTVHRVKGFSSTSYHASWGTYYARGRDANMQRIKLLRGTHVIAASILNPWENGGQGEIIINSGTKYIVRSRNVLRSVMQQGLPKRMRVTDVTVIPDGPSNKNINKV